MTKSMLVPIKIVNLSADPTAPAGSLYYNTGTNLLKFYNGTSWANVGSNYTPPLTQTALSTGFSIAGGTTSKTLQINNTLTLAGTDGTTITFPATSGTVATLNTTNTFTTTQTVTPSTSVTGLAVNAAASSVGITVKANATTPDDIQQWLDSGGTVRSRIDSTGYNFYTSNIYISSIIGNSSNATIYAYNSGGSSSGNPIIVASNQTGSVPLTIKGTTSQNADLTQWQDTSGNVLLNVNSSGVLGTSPTAATSTNSNAISIKTGNATGTTSNSGSVTIDAGTATGTVGSLLIGNTNATTITIGRSSGVTTTINGTSIPASSTLAVIGSNNNFSTSQTITGSLTATSIVKSGGTSSQYLMANGSTSLGYILPDIIPLDNLQYQFDGIESRFYPKNAGIVQTITNPFTLLLSLNGIIQNISFPEVVWGTPFSYDGFTIDSDGYIAFSEPPPAGSTFFAKIQAGPATQVTTNIYPFRAMDILLGAY